MKTNLLLPNDGKNCVYTLEESGLYITYYRPICKELGKILMGDLKYLRVLYFKRTKNATLYYLKQTAKADLNMVIYHYHKLKRETLELRDNLMLEHEAKIKDMLFLNKL